MSQQPQNKLTWDEWFKHLSRWSDESPLPDKTDMGEWPVQEAQRRADESIKELRKLFADKQALLRELAESSRFAKWWHGQHALANEVALLEKLTAKAGALVKTHQQAYIKALDGERMARARSARLAAHQRRLQRAELANAKVQKLPTEVKAQAPQPQDWPSANPAHSADYEYVNLIENWLKSRAPDLLALHLASEHVNALRTELLAHESTIRQLGNILDNSCRSLHRSLNLDALHSFSLADLTSKAANLRTPEGLKPYRFLALWSAVHSCLRYAELARGDTAVEAERAALWVTAWWEAVRQWPEQCLQVFGCTKGNTGTAVARVGSSAVETQLGSDVVLIIWANDDNVPRAHVLNIQFKKAVKGNTTLNVERERWRQFAALATTDLKSGGRLAGCYGLLRDQPAGIGSICAVDISDAAKALGQNVSSINHHSANFSLDWTAIGETLPTAVLRSLSGPTFSAPHQAMASLASAAGRDLDGYVIVQAFGFDQKHLMQEMTQCSEIGRQMKMGFETSPSVLRNLGLEPDAQRGHSPTRG